jgi:N-acetylneuraminate synthase
VNSGVWIIAEAGVNHNGDLSLALELVEAAAEAGADAVKFQTFLADDLAAPTAGLAAYQLSAIPEMRSQREMLRALELSYDSFRQLAQHALACGIEFMSTAFDTRSLEFLVRELGIKRVKIPSGELTNSPDLYRAARFGLPMIISTGMATSEEVAGALDVAAYALLNDDPPTSRAQMIGARRLPEARQVLREMVTLLHCTSEYPAPVERANLLAMRAMREDFDVPVGYSDHTAGVTVSTAAVTLGATVIEKHLTLNRQLPGPDHAASLEPRAFADLVRSCRDAESALGSPLKAPTEVEAATAKQVRKSLVASRYLALGQVLGPDDITMKRPAGGLPPDLYWDLLGKSCDRSYVKDQPIVCPPS